MDIALALAEMGQKVERRKIRLGEPIKEIGEFDVLIKLHRDVNPSIKVVVRKVGTEEPALAAPATAEAEATAQLAAPAVDEVSSEESSEESPEESYLSL